MSIYEMRLTDESFDLIKQGKKTIESRLYDKKRQQIKIGDTIIFKNRDKQTEPIEAKVVELLHYPTFVKLFAAEEPIKFGRNYKEGLISQIYQFYSKEDEAKYGVVGIRVKKQF